MYGVKWAYFDLDGTLIPKSQKISNRTVMAISYLRSQGVKVGIATGRSFFLTDSIAKELNVDLPIICSNGAWVLKKDHFVTMKEYFIKNESQHELLRVLNQQKLDYMIYTLEGIYSTSEDFPFYKKILDMKQYSKSMINHEICVKSDRNFYKTQKILKILVGYKTDIERIQLKTWIQDIPNINYVSSQDNILDIFDSEADKSTAIKWLLSKYDIKPHELIVFGDNENDIKMFQLTSKSVVMSQATDKVKRYAKRTTEFSCEDEGIADFIFRNF